MVYSEFRKDVPEWVKELWLTTCPDCGSLIVDNSDEGNGTTARWCPNPSCPDHLKYKVKALADYFKLTGIGPSTAKSIIKKYGLKNQFQIMPLWFKDFKPQATLVDIAVLADIDGIGKASAEELFGTYKTFEQYFQCAYNQPACIVKNKDMLLDAQNYFTLLKPHVETVVRVQLHGNFRGYKRRDDFIRAINTKYGEYVHVLDAGSTMTGCSCLIMENGAAVQSKVVNARRVGLPIVTPDEFLAYIIKYYVEA